MKSNKMRSCKLFLKFLWGPIILGIQFKRLDVFSMIWLMPLSPTFSHPILYFLQYTFFFF